MIRAIETARPSRRRRGMRGLGAVQMYAAPSATNPQQVAVTGLPAAGITTASDPMFFLNAATAQQFINDLNAQAATNASAGIGLMQTVRTDLASLPDEVLAPLMSHGCVTQGQIGDQARIVQLSNWLYAHPEARGGGLWDSYCTAHASQFQLNPNAVNTTPQAQITVTNAGATLPGWNAPTSATTPATNTSTGAQNTTTTTTPAGASSGNTSTTPAGNNQGSTTTSTSNGNQQQPTNDGGNTQSGDPGTPAGVEVVGDPRGIFDQIIATLPPALQDVATKFRQQAGAIPVWVWALLAGAILFWIESKKRGTR